MSEADEFMSRVMSNLDGNKDGKIAVLVGALRAVAAAKMPGEARRIALEALRDHVGSPADERGGE